MLWFKTTIHTHRRTHANRARAKLLRLSHTETGHTIRLGCIRTVLQLLFLSLVSEKVCLHENWRNQLNFSQWENHTSSTTELSGAKSNKLNSRNIRIDCKVALNQLHVAQEVVHACASHLDEVTARQEEVVKPVWINTRIKQEAIVALKKDKPGTQPSVNRRIDKPPNTE